MKALAAALTALLLSSSCDYKPPRDYYSEVVNDCGYWGGDAMTDGCRAALLAIIPFDDSWKEAPPGFQESVLNAFRALVGYPMKLPPKNTFLGLGEYSMPLAHLRTVDPDDERDGANLNQNLFNYVLDQVDVYQYSGASDHYAAYYDYPVIEGDRRVRIFDPFLGYGAHIGRAAVLAHESRHGDGNPHMPCPENDSPFGAIRALLDGEDHPTCDGDLIGPYGLEAMTEQMIVRGSWERLSKFEISVLGWDICDRLSHVYRLPDALKKLVKEDKCWPIDYGWMADHEGLPRH